MVYLWKDNNTGIEVAVNRKVKEIEIPPDKDEIPEEMTMDDFGEADWIRVMQGFEFIGEKGKGFW